MNDRIGQQLGNYRLIRRLGSGGFAEVYLGEHVYLKTQAAIKVLPMQLTSDEIENFSNEARTIANLKHPYIIPVLDFGIQESTSTPFLVMDYAPNGTLRQRYKKGTKVSPKRLLPYVKQVAEALQYAHDNNIIHRDVKPENILLAQNNSVLLSDFGLAIVVQSSQHQESQQNMGAGTIAYTAPEQSKGKPCVASDQYSLGAIVYEMLCGVRPFNGTPMEIMVQHALASPAPIHDHVPSIPPAIEFVVQKALAKDPKKRFATIQKFAQALEDACQRENSENRTTQLVSAGRAAMPQPATTPIVERERIPPMVATPPQDSSVIWNVPYRRNPFFTGRETILASVHEKLHAGKAMSQIQAISGLGGSGKTQIAIEYAYRHHNNYNVILWIRGDRREMLREDCAIIASQLSMKGKSEDIIGTVKAWLKANTNWLLILDNVENLTVLRTFIPSNVRGHVLLTTRTQTTGTIAQRIELCKMARDEAKLFLLRRIRKLSHDAPLSDASQSDSEKANEIAELVGDLPLALDQAGAYIEETGCSLNDYLSLYSTRRARLLAMRGGIGADHAASVTATFVHSFEKVAQASPIAIDLLRFCAFLDPNAIPEELIIHAAEVLGPTLQPVASDPLVLDTAIAVLRKHSLVHRAAETKLLSLHPLVQAVLRDRMSAEKHQEWVERTVRAVNHAFPDIEEVHMWHRCQPAMPHVQACIALIKTYKLLSPEAVRLLYQAGMYFRIQAQYSEAEVLLEQAATMHKQQLPTQKETATDLSIAFWHHYRPGQYSLVEPLIQKELAYAEKVLGSDNQHVATIRLKLAELYYKQGKYSQAEQLLLQSLSIKEQHVGLLHACVACNFNGLGLVCLTLGKYSLAQSYLLHALTVWERLPEPRHPFMGRTLNALARLSLVMGEYRQAEVYLQKERVLLEQTLQPMHPAIITSLNEWAVLCIAQGRYDQVEILLDQAQTIIAKTIGSKHLIAGRVLHTLARFYTIRGKYIQAEQILQEVLGICEQALGFEHPEVAAIVNTLADVYVAQSQRSLAEALYKQALEVREKVLGIEHPDVAQTLNSLAGLYFTRTEYQRAEQYYKKALAICEKALGCDHPDVAQTLNDLARLYSNRRHYAEAEPLFRRALAIREKTLGPEHIEVAATKKSFSLALWALGKRTEATACIKHVKQIQAKHMYSDVLNDV
jgi:serine/threonine protein kinase